MAPTQSKPINEDDGKVDLIMCPKELLTALKAVPKDENEELGMYLDDVVRGCAKHRSHKEWMRTSFISFLENDPKYKDQMVLVDVDGIPTAHLIATAMPSTAGCPQYKKELVNMMLVDFSSNMKKKTPAKKVQQ